MLNYKIQASLEGSLTTIPISARNDFHARTIAIEKCSANWKSDKRWAVGKIVVINPKGLTVYVINEESKEDSKGVKE